MKVTVTYKDSHQISMDDWAVHTEVIHLDPKMTLIEAHELLTKGIVNQSFNGEIHFTTKGEE